MHRVTSNTVPHLVVQYTSNLSQLPFVALELIGSAAWSSLGSLVFGEPVAGAGFLAFADDGCHLGTAQAMRSAELSVK